MSTRGKRIGQVIAGVVVGLGLAEAAFWIRDDGAFPHVAFYVSDDTLGARLQPNASQRISFGGNPTTTITTNAKGYRGPDWPIAGANKTDVVVVGDSQVYGLGVDHEATFSSMLATESKRTVLNGGVPTYGPFEYAGVVDEVLAERGASTSHVVFVVNLSNDLFEATRRNTERHEVWDGWAVRSETMPTDYVKFPGRELLFSKSHAVFALRKLLTKPPEGDDRGFSSEGGWQDLVQEAQRPRDVPHATPKDDDGGILYGVVNDPTTRARVKAEHEMQMLKRHVDAEASRRLLMDIESATEEEGRRIAEHRGSAIDIVVSEYAEAGREVAQTASILLAAAQVRKRNDEALRALAKKKDDLNLQRLLDDKEKARAALDAAAHPIVVDETPPSPLRETLERVKASCDKHGVTLVVVALPLDVMVSPEEWAKYGVPESERADMSATTSLVQGVLDDAKAVGAVGLDVTAALKSAQPGAFLDKDLHMSAKGHAAVAKALVPKLAEPPPLARPRPGLPERRSLTPTDAEWSLVVETNVKGSSAAACETKEVREWLRVSCHKTDALVPTGVVVEKGGAIDTSALSAGESAVLLAPIVAGGADTAIEARFLWRDHSRVLTALRGADGKLVASFGERDVKRALPPQQKRERDAAKTLCDSYYDGEQGRPIVNCDLMNGFLEPSTSEHTTAPRILSFARPLPPPTCGEDAVQAGAFPICSKLCDALRPCDDVNAVCAPWMGAHVCRPSSQPSGTP